MLIYISIKNLIRWYRGRAVIGAKYENLYSEFVDVGYHNQDRLGGRYVEPGNTWICFFKYRNSAHLRLISDAGFENEVILRTTHICELFKRVDQ